MGELIQKNGNCATIRWSLLTSASALALTAYVSAANVAEAEDADRPTVWIEVGGQLDRFSGQGSPFTPDFVNTFDWGAYNLKSPGVIQKTQPSSFGGSTSVSIQPSDSDWVFSASVRYGRSNSHKFLHQQKTAVTHFQTHIFGSNKYHTKTAPASYAQTSTNKSEDHFIADFQAGKDVGLGMFGRNSESEVSVGVRFAQMSEKAQTAIYARPGVGFVPGTFRGSPVPTLGNYHHYLATAQRAASFHGVGPSLSWNASAPMAGKASDGEVTIDWGVNAAILFGRQRVQAHHHTTGGYRYISGTGKYKQTKTVVLPSHAGHRTNSRSIVVPNLGGFAGVSFRYANAKMSVGYRADFFFGAVDNGLDTRDAQTRGYYGPFASVSIGLGG